jgi:Fe-S cluster biosynthesis and repair protein YggX
MSQFQGTKLKTLKKQENRSQWESNQFKMQPMVYSNVPRNPWQYFEYEKQMIPNSPNNNNINNYGRLTKREQNTYLFTKKLNTANNYFKYKK